MGLLATTRATSCKQNVLTHRDDKVDVIAYHAPGFYRHVQTLTLKTFLTEKAGAKQYTTRHALAQLTKSTFPTVMGKRILLQLAIRQLGNSCKASIHHHFPPIYEEVAAESHYNPHRIASNASFFFSNACKTLSSAIQEQGAARC